MDVREKLEVIAHLGDHITYKEDIGICYDSDLAKVIEDAYMELKNGVTVQEWISVKDRLPEKITNKVIVLCKNGYRGFGHYENYKGKQTWYNLESDKPFTDWDLEDCESYEVTHWMPLPQPPKGE